jgi:hypothetical protein
MLWLRLELLELLVGWTDVAVLTTWLETPVWMFVRTLRSFSVSLVTISFLIGAFGFMRISVRSERRTTPAAPIAAVQLDAH